MRRKVIYLIVSEIASLKKEFEGRSLETVLCQA